MEMINNGDPPRNVTHGNIIHSLHKQWRIIISYTSEAVIRKKDAFFSKDEEPISFDDMLIASLDFTDE